jgi:hypothetical protein
MRGERINMMRDERINMPRDILIAHLSSAFLVSHPPFSSLIGFFL